MVVAEVVSTVLVLLNIQKLDYVFQEFRKLRFFLVSIQSINMCQIPRKAWYVLKGI